MRNELFLSVAGSGDRSHAGVQIHKKYNNPKYLLQTYTFVQAAGESFSHQAVNPASSSTPRFRLILYFHLLHISCNNKKKPFYHLFFFFCNTLINITAWMHMRARRANAGPLHTVCGREPRPASTLARSLAEDALMKHFSQRGRNGRVPELQRRPRTSPRPGRSS